MHPIKFALVLSLTFGIPGIAYAQPAPDVSGVGAIELPEFNLSAEPSGMNRQLGLHRERLASAQGELRRGGAPEAVTTLSVLIDQLEFRIALLEIVLTPLPLPSSAADARLEQVAMLRTDQSELAALAERGKTQGIGTQNQSVLEARLAEIHTLIAELEGAGTPDTTPLEPSRAVPNGPAQPDPVPTPATPDGPPATPELRTPPPVTLGDFISTLGNLEGRVDEVQQLPTLDPARIFVVPAESLFRGKGIGPIGRAIDRGYFADLRAFIMGSPVLLSALTDAGYSAEEALGLLADGEGNVVIFVG